MKGETLMASDPTMVGIMPFCDVHPGDDPLRLGNVEFRSMRTGLLRIPEPIRPQVSAAAPEGSGLLAIPLTSMSRNQLVQIIGVLQYLVLTDRDSTPGLLHASLIELGHSSTASDYVGIHFLHRGTYQILAAPLDRSRPKPPLYRQVPFWVRPHRFSPRLKISGLESLLKQSTLSGTDGDSARRWLRAMRWMVLSLADDDMTASGQTNVVAALNAFETVSETWMEHEKHKKIAKWLSKLGNSFLLEGGFEAWVQAAYHVRSLIVHGEDVSSIQLDYSTGEPHLEIAWDVFEWALSVTTNPDYYKAFVGYRGQVADLNQRVLRQWEELAYWSRLVPYSTWIERFDEFLSKYTYEDFRSRQNRRRELNSFLVIHHKVDKSTSGCDALIVGVVRSLLNLLSTFDANYGLPAAGKQYLADIDAWVTSAHGRTIAPIPQDLMDFRKKDGLIPAALANAILELQRDYETLQIS